MNTETTLVIDVLKNDTDPNGDEIQIVGVSTPTHGTAELDDNGTNAFHDDRIRYQPEVGFKGTVEFNYELSDGLDGKASGVVTIAISTREFGDKNIAQHDQATTSLSNGVMIDVLSNDVSENEAQITSFSQASNGTISLDTFGTSATDDDRLIYTPNAGFSGYDSFVYELNSSSVAGVTVSVTNSTLVPEPFYLRGRVVKGPVSGAVVTLYPLNSQGVEDRTTPLSQTVTDQYGFWTSSLGAQATDVLVVARGGNYHDESKGDYARVPIQIGSTNEFSSVLPAGEHYAATTLYSSALLRRTLAEVTGTNFSDVLEQNRQMFTTALGFDVIQTQVADPLFPNVAINSNESVSYGMIVGGAAEALNQIDSALNLSVSQFAVIDAVIDDLTDCWLDANGINGAVTVLLNNQLSTIPNSVNLNAQILRFRNNLLERYAGVPITAIDQNSCTQAPSLLDTTPPVFSFVPDPLVISVQTSTGILSSDVIIGAFLSSVVATDLVDGSVAVTHDAPATLPIGVTSIEFSAADMAGNIATVTQSVTVVVNGAPTALLIDDLTVDENTPAELVGTLSTVDADGPGPYTYGLVSGSGADDNALFTLLGSQLRTLGPLDFEQSATRSVRIQTRDAQNGIFTTSFTVLVNDVNEGPATLSLSSASVSENVPGPTLIGTLSTDDPDSNAVTTTSYATTTGMGDADNAVFDIVGNQLRLLVPTDFETQPIYSVRIRATDAGGERVDSEFTIAVNDVNEAPTAVSLTGTNVDENVAGPVVIGTLQTNDPDGNAGTTTSYATEAGVGDTDNAAFDIVGNQLRLLASADFETQPSYAIRIKATDAGGSSIINMFTITVNDVNDAPTVVNLTNNSIDENISGPVVIGILQTIDPDGNASATTTYAAEVGIGDTDNAAFDIVGDQLRLLVSADFETQSSYSVRIKATDAGGATISDTFAISVSDVNEAPALVSLTGTSIDENTTGPVAIGTLQTDDPDSNASTTTTYATEVGVGDTDNAAFDIIGDQLRLLASADFETQSSYSVRINATDVGGESISATFTIAVNDMNEVPTVVSVTGSTVDENTTGPVVIGTLQTNDPDGNASTTTSYVTEAGLGDADNAAFDIVGDQLRLLVSADFETQPSYSLRIKATDAGGASISDTFTISVNDINEAPTVVSLTSTSIDENIAGPVAIGTLQTNDPDGNASTTTTYATEVGLGDTDNAAFDIVGDQLRLLASADFETQSSYSLRIKATDAGGASISDAFMVTVNDVNEAPTVISVTDNSIDENVGGPVVIGTLQTDDPDSNASVTTSYAIAVGVGDEDNAAFDIIGDQLRLLLAADFETQPIYSVRVEATDAGGQTASNAITILINDLPESDDFDSDGISDSDENALVDTFGGPPGCPFANNPDSDGDSIGDGAEIRAGGNPCINDPKVIVLVDPTGAFPGSVTSIPADPGAGSPGDPHYVLIMSGTYVTDLTPASCDDLHYVGSQDFSQPGVIISDAVTGLPTTTINLNGLSAVANGCGNLVIQDIAMTNGTGANSFNRGGAIRAINGSIVTLEHVHLHNNSADDQGGAVGISNAGTVVTINNSLLENNLVSNDKGGGGIWIGNGATLIMDSTRIARNTVQTTGGGGGLYVDHGTNVIITNSWIVENNSVGSGGGIEINHTVVAPISFEINNTLVAGNVAANSGGGLHVSGSAVDSSVIDILNSQFVGNAALGNGGAVSLDNSQSSVNLHNVLINGNSAVAGAGVFVTNNSTPVLQNLTLTYNAGTDAAGAGVFRDAGSPTVLDSILWSNRAGGRAFSAPPSLGDNYTGGIVSDFNLLEIDKSGSSDIDLVTDGVQPFFTQAFYLDQLQSPAIDTGSNTSVNLTLNTYFTGPTSDAGQVDRGYHYNLPEATAADGYREVGGSEINNVTVQNGDSGSNAKRLLIEPHIGGVILGPGHQVIATLSGSVGFAQLRPASDIDPLGDGESALLIDQGDGRYAVNLDAVGAVGSTVYINIEVTVDGVDLGSNAVVKRVP